MLGRLAAGLVAILTFSRRADSLTGPAKVIDGDTIVVAGQMVRLHGIDAPELDQPFWWRGQQLVCNTPWPPLRPSRPVSSFAARWWSGIGTAAFAKVFSPNGVDIGRRLVAAGWALAYRRYSMGYVDAEDEARKAKRGMWRGTLVKPWVWRASSSPQRLDSVRQEPSDQRILKRLEPCRRPRASWRP